MLTGLFLLACVLARGASDSRRWRGEKTLSAWLVGDVRVELNATELMTRRHFAVDFAASGWVRLVGSFNESDRLDVRFNDDLKEGEWIALKQEHECSDVETTGAFTSFSVNGTRKRLDPRRYCKSKLAPSHAEIMLGECSLLLRVSYFGMWHTLELLRDPACQPEEL